MKEILLLVMLVAAGLGAADDLRIDVVESTPDLAQMLAAAVDAALETFVLATAEEETEAGAERAAGEDRDKTEDVLTATGARVAAAEPGEPLALPAHICGAASGGAHAVLGESGPASTAAAARAGVPLLLTSLASPDSGQEALELYPPEETLAEAIAVLVKEKGWKQCVLLHSGPRPAALGDGGLRLAARRLPPPRDDATLRDLLLVLKRAGATQFIVWAGANEAVRVLDAAQRVGLLSERHSYLLPALELHTLPLHAFSHGGANVTGLMIYDPESPAVSSAMRTWYAAYARRMGSALDERAALAAARAPPSSLLLAWDVTVALAAALADLGLPTARGGDCETGQGAFHADTLLNYIRSTQWDGISGVLSWDATGARHHSALTVTELSRGGLMRRVGSMSPGDGVRWTRRPRPVPPLPPTAMANRTFTVLIALNEPYVMRRKSLDRLSGNNVYEGFCIDLIEKLAQDLGFNYTFEQQADGAYGVYNETTKQWTGMMKRLREDPNVDFAITDLTITAEREKAVDFTTPFMNLGISILFRKPKPPEPKLFAFMLPFSNGVWLCLGVAYLGTSLVLYVVGRLCPEEWQNPYPCVEEPEQLENQFTLANALWFNLGAVLLQGSEIAPVAYGTRAVASVWWLFALVITSSYTANLATLLAQQSTTETIRNVEELARNDQGITYGAKDGGSTYTFFQHSQAQSTLYKQMYDHMKEQKMPPTNEAGIKKVMNESYAFLMESTTIEYVIERNCLVTMVGDLLDSKGYGIAMKKESPYRQALNLALLKLQENGVLREMKHTWWKEKHGGGACAVSEDRESQELSMRNFEGLFLVLAIGCALGVCVSVADLAWRALRHPRLPDRSRLRNLAAELKFVFQFERDVKPVQGPLFEPVPTPSESSAGTEEQQPEPERPSSPAANGALRRRRSSMQAASTRLARAAQAARDQQDTPTSPVRKFSRVSQRS